MEKLLETVRPFKPSPGDDLLDIACGTASFFFSLSEHRDDDGPGRIPGPRFVQDSQERPGEKVRQVFVFVLGFEHLSNEPDYHRPGSCIKIHGPSRIILMTDAPFLECPASG